MKMDDAVRKAGVKSVCGFVLRYNPMVETAFAMARDGMFGDLLYVQTDYWHNPEQSGYPNQHDHIRRMDSSAMILGGCHAVDLARYLPGSDIVQVTAVQTTGTPDAPFPPMQAAIVTFANGKIGKISACVEQWMPYQFNVDLLGTDGGLRDNRFFSLEIVGRDRLGDFPDGDPEQRLWSAITRSTARSATSSTASGTTSRAMPTCGTRSIRTWRCTRSMSRAHCRRQDDRGQ